MFAAALCLCALFFAPPAAIGYAEGEAAVVVSKDGVETPYTDISAALSAWRDGTTLRLSESVTRSASLEVTGNKTLDLNGFTLSSAGGRTLQVRGDLVVTDESPMQNGSISGGGVRIYSGSFTLNNGSIRENASADGAGVYVETGASCTINGGSISRNQATEGNGGGVFVAVGASFTMNGGYIVDNTAHLGGGIYGGGTIVLCGNASVFENKGGNLYLPEGVTVQAKDVTGRIGVTCAGGTAVFAKGTGSGFFADDATYLVKESGNALRLSLSPLVSVSAQFDGSVTVYPTTLLETLTDRIVLSGTNENGVLYPESEIRRVALSFAGDAEAFLPGENEILISVTGADGEEVAAQCTVMVVIPSLIEITAMFDGNGAAVYFDTPLEALYERLTVEGTYTDGVVRTLSKTAEQTAQINGESYITDFYGLSGNPSEHENGIAVLTVSVKNYATEVSVTVSKHLFRTEEMSLQDVTAVQNSGDWKLDPYAFFVQELPSGIEPKAVIEGGLEEKELSAGTYRVTITFLIRDPKNYAVEGDNLTGNLIVNRDKVVFSDEAGNAFCEAKREGGIPLGWTLAVTDVTGKVTAPRLDGDWESRQIIEIALRDGGAIVTQIDGGLQIRLLLDGRLHDDEVRVYRVLSDGGVIEVEAERDGDYLVFRATSATQYIVAVDNGYTVYLVLAVIFGVVCIVGAGGLVWYFVKRRNLKLR